MDVCASGQACVWAYTWRPEDILKCHSSGTISHQPIALMGQGWLTSNSQEPISFPGMGLQVWAISLGFIYRTYSDGSQALMLTRQMFRHLSSTCSRFFLKKQKSSSRCNLFIPHNCTPSSICSSSIAVSCVLYEDLVCLTCFVVVAYLFVCCSFVVWSII